MHSRLCLLTVPWTDPAAESPGCSIAAVSAALALRTSLETNAMILLSMSAAMLLALHRQAGAQSTAEFNSGAILRRLLNLRHAVRAASEPPVAVQLCTKQPPRHYCARSAAGVVAFTRGCDTEQASLNCLNYPHTTSQPGRSRRAHTAQLHRMFEPVARVAPCLRTKCRERFRAALPACIQAGACSRMRSAM